MRKKWLMTVATPLFALFAHSQQFPSASPSSTDDSLFQQGQQSTLNCNDPSMATSPQCLGGPGTGLMQGSPYSQGGSVTGTLPGQPGRVTTYTDEPSRSANTRRNNETIPLQPEPLTEFQKFIASTTGVVLPVYGASLFQNAPSTFAPLENVPVSSDYIVGPDDDLRIRVWGQVNFNADLRVDRSGDVYLPQIGNVHVAGLHFGELRQHVHDAIGRVYRNFDLAVEMGQIRSIQVYVIGEARRSGLYTVSALSTLIDALFSSGGPSTQGSLRHIELRRAGQTVTTLDLYDLLINGDKSKDSQLEAGDVIFIPPVGAQVALMGSVRRPAIYELANGDTVASVLRDAGGATALASQSRASVDRTLEHNGRVAMEIRLDASGLATPLEDGDLVHILPLVSKFDKTVTLRGNTANPGRFAWHEGMRVSDLIPDRQSLLTRDYWWKRVQLGLPSPEFQPLPQLSAFRQPASPIDLRENPQGLRQNPNQQTTAGNQQNMRPGAGPDNSTNAALAAQAAENPFASNQYQQQQNTSQQRGAETQGGQSALAEQDEDSPDQTLAPKSLTKTTVRLQVPEIDWSYAVIERTDPNNLKTTLLSFDLGKLVIDHDQSQDLPLQPGDVVTVFSQSDIHVPIAEQTTFVRLEGEFVHAGTYSVLPGETLRSLIERVGGVTPNAFLYGSVFTRESTRILQQRRIDESVREFALQMQRGNLALAAAPASNAQDLAGVNAAQSSEQAILAQLKQVRANGRIVFQFTPDSQGAGAVPDIRLENGDTFLIPSLPSTVNVLGAVYNQNSFVYRRGGELRSFLELAGGPNSAADSKRMFVVRANGAVVSRSNVKGTWASESFFHLKLNPGDTIIVPEKTIKPSALRGVLDWTQILAQMAFGAAAINTLR